MKKFLDLSSWSRWSLSLSKGAAIGSIRHTAAAKLQVYLLTVLALTFSLAACGDDDSSFAPRDNTVSDSDIVVESFDDLPVCSSKREGATAYIKDEKTAYICTDSSWVPEEESSSSSSETTQSSSSITTATPCNVDGVNNCVYGSLTDSRDGQTYRTVKIGTQTWMAENLNYETGNSYCYNDADSNCTKYGRLYTWASAKKACPEGWHLPSDTEIETLFTAVGGRSRAGAKLKAQTGWTAYDGITNEDAFGFSALPAGDRDDNGGYDYEGSYAGFWSSTDYDSHNAYSMYLDYGYDYASLSYSNKYYGFSVRCVKD